jgi:hypothetical protein
VNGQQTTAIEVLIARVDRLASALQRAQHDDPYSDEVVAVAMKLDVAKAALRKVRLAELAAAELDGVMAGASVMESTIT